MTAKSLSLQPVLNIVISMFRRAMVLFIVFTILGFSYSYSVIYPMAGATCAKAGVTQLYLGKKYTCIKSGKKLFWDKGINIAKPILKSSPSPSPIQSSIQTPSSSPNLNPTPAATSIPTPLSTPQTSSQNSYGPTVGSECQTVGNRIQINSFSYLECRMVSGGKYRFMEISNSEKIPINKSSLGNIRDCQIPDQTNRSRYEAQGSPIGYVPDRRQSSTYPTEGSFNIAILPIDFSDFPGGYLDENELKKFSSIIETWFNYESNGKLKVSVLYVNKWLRAPRVSHEYNWNHPGTQNPTNLSDDQIGQDFANIADPYVDFHKVGALFIMHPDRNPNIEYGTLADVKLQTAEGFVSPYLVSNGFNVDRQDGAIWAYWIHEIGHRLGIVGHSPDELMSMDLMNSQSGYGLSTTTWNQLLLDWLLPTQLYCQTIDNLNSDEVTLTSIDSLKNGVKSAMIAMSPNEILVIESRRKDYWTSFANTMVKNRKEAFDGFYGVEIYLVDTSKVNNQNKYAKNLLISAEHPSRFMDIDGLQYFMFLGESITFRNIKISLVESGSFDTVKIEKI